MIKKVNISKTHIGLIERLQHFNDNPSPLPALKKEETKKLFEEAKDRFFNFKESKWPVKPCREFINHHKLDPQAFIDFLEYLFSTYFEDKTTGQIIANDLIETLRTSKNFNSSGFRNKGIQLKKDKNVQDFINGMKDIMSFTEMSQEDIVKFISKNFNTGYTLSTLRRYYMDNQK